MRFRFRHAPALLALLAGTAQGAPLLGPAPSDRLAAGRVEIVGLAPAKRGVTERELVLSLDGGKSFPVRLTREIEPDERTVTWRVPILPTEHAVLALREGGEGFEEEIVATSAEFAILPTPGSPLEELRLRSGEWKTREADAGDDGLPSRSLGSAEPKRISPLEETFAAFEEPVRAIPGAPDAETASDETAAPSRPSSERSPRPSVTPSLPLRE